MTSPATVVLQGGFTLEIDPADADPVVQALLSGELMTRDTSDVVELKVTNGQTVRFRVGAVVAVILSDAEIGEAAAQLRPPASAGGPFLIMEDFLPPDLHGEVLRLTLAAEGRFQPSATVGGSGRSRSSLVLREEPPIVALMSPCLRRVLPEIVRRLGLERQAEGNDPPAMECQVTAHNDGDFYGLHNDSGAPMLRHRTLSYVYYFRSRPRPFRGGELRIYDIAVEGGFYVAGDRHWLVEPQDNSIVFFPSHAMHEVLPVSCASKLFADSRFTVNGWVSL
jgi:hypothetical protein